jgi:nucleotidyltransferase/DNA polymerase involved in DNA repair
MKVLSEELESIPGVGKSIAQDLRELGVFHTSDLIGKDPQGLYDEHCRLKGRQIDRCVLYTFRCAVYAASSKHPDPKKLLWWNWMDEKI